MATNIDEFEGYLDTGVIKTNGPEDWKYEPKEDWDTDQWDEWIGRSPVMTMDDETASMIANYKKIKNTGGTFKYYVWEDGTKKEVSKRFKIPSVLPKGIGDHPDLGDIEQITKATTEAEIDRGLEEIEIFKKGKYAKKKKSVTKCPTQRDSKNK